MSNTTSKHTVIVDSNIKQTTKEAEGLNATLAKAAATAKRVAIPAARARQAAGMDGAELGRESGMARSIGPGTGASGRDFAKQSEGLGGLVRVYATFAANIFAATAAFGALSRAVDTSNLVKGLDQLGVASGKNLGTLSKHLVAAADGAISLKDAMTSVAQASSGGMSNANIVKMAEVAKRASQALGRDMPDALNRLTRGITKLEPELLDEIGIMIRLDTTSQDYANSVGKSVSALTMFEKRQAFANAVLAQGAEKFGQIELSANAYSKILASSQNLLQSGLELVNKVLTPLIGFLAQSPTGLAVTLAAIAGTLLKQAIPAIGTYRKNMQLAADESLVRLSKVYKDQQTLASENDRKIADAAVETFRKSAATQAKLAALKNVGFTKGGKDWNAISSQSPFEITEKDLKALESRAKLLMAKQDSIQKQEGIALKAHVADMRAIRQQDNDIHENTASAQEMRDNKRFSHQTQLVRILDKETQAASNRRILAMTAETAATVGPVRAWKAMNEEIAKSKAGKAFILVPKLDENGQRVVLDGIEQMEKRGVKATGVLSNGFTRLKGAIGIATSAVGTFMNAFGIWFQVIGLVIGGLSLLNSWASKNTKEVEAFEDSITTLKSAMELADKVVTSISKKDPLAQITTQSISARAEALMGLNDALKDTLNKFNAANASANKFDTNKDWIASLFGGGRLNTAATEMAQTITKALNLATAGVDKTRAKNRLFDILGVDPEDFAALEKVLGKSKAGFISLAPQAAKAIETLGIAASNTASKAKALDDGFLEAGKAFDAVIFSALPSDNLTKLGTSFMTLGNQMKDAFENPLTAMNKLVEISKDITKLRFIDPKTAKQLMDLGPLLAVSVKQVQEQRNILEELDKEEKKIIKESANARPADRLINDARLGDNKTKRKQAEATIDSLNQATIKPALELLRKAQVEAFHKGADLVEASIMQGFTKAGILVSKAFSSLLDSTGSGAIDAKERQAKQEADLQLQQLNVTKSLIEVDEKLRQAVEENSIMQGLALANAQRNNPGASGKTVAEIDEEVKKLNVRLEALKITRSGVFTGSAAFQVVKASRDKDASPALQMAGESFRTENMRKLAVDAQAAQITAQKVAAEIAKQGELVDYRIRKEKELLDLAASSINLEKTKFDAQTRLLPYLNTELLLRKEALDESAAANKVAQERLNFQARIDKQSIVFKDSRATGADRTEAAKNLQDVAREYANFLKKTDDETAARNSAQSIARMENAKKEFDTKTAISNIYFSKEIANENARIDLQEERVNSLEALGAVSKQYLTTQTASIALAKEELRSREAIRKATQDIAAAQFDKQQIESTTGPLPDGATAKQDAAIAAGRAILSNELSLTEAKKESIKAQEAFNLLLADQADSMDRMIEATQSLATVFGDVGAAMGDSLQALLTFNQTQEKYDKAKVARDKEMDKASADPEEWSRLKIEQNKADKKNQLDQIKGVASLAGATKKMFAEKTAAHKVLAGVEKAAHIASIAMQAVELQATLTKAAAGLAAVLPGVAGKIFSQLGAWGFPVVGAALAVINSLGGKSKSVNMAGMSAADRQETQGTGQSWVDGKKVENGNGVFGDSEAKSESIKNSIEIIKDNAIEGLKYDRGMLDALQSIDASISGVSRGLAAIPGIRTGSSFGTQEGMVGKSGISGLFGSSTSQEVTDAGIKVTGMFTDLSNGMGSFLQYEDVLKTKTKSGFFGLGKSSSQSLETSTKPLEAALSEQISNIFSNATVVFNKVAKDMGKSSAFVIDTLASLPVAMTASLKGLSGKDLESAFNAVVSQQLDAASSALFSEMKKFAKFGEGLLETVVRVVDGSKKVTVALDSIGLSLDIPTEIMKTVIDSPALNNIGEEIGGWIGNVIKAATTPRAYTRTAEEIQQETFRITESLIEAAGGLGEFNDQIKFFSDNFLTEAERLAPVQRNVTSTLNELSVTYGKSDIALINTRDGFKNLLLSLNLAEEADATLYSELMKLAPAFTMVYEEAEKSKLTLKDLKSTFDNLTDTFNKASMSGNDYRDFVRARDTKGLDPEAIAQYDANTALQDKIDILKEESTISKLNNDILRAQGRNQQALNNERAEELRLLPDAVAEVRRLVHAKQDELALLKLENTLRNTDIDLLKAQGKDAEALSLQRARELETMSVAEQAIQNLIYARQDEIKVATEATSLSKKYADLDVELLKAQGKDTEALALQRQRELDLLDPTNRALGELIDAREDEITAATKVTALKKEYSDLEVELLRAQGKDTAALKLEREREQVGMNAEQKALSDLNNTRKDEIRVATEATSLAQRNADLDIEVLTARSELLKANKDNAGALVLSERTLALTRERELDATDPLNREALRVIHRRQDEVTAIRALIAAQDRLKAARENLEQGYISAVEAFKAASDNLISAIINIKQKAKEITSSISSILNTAKDKVDSTSSSLQSAREGISDKLFAAQDALADIQKQITDKSAEEATKVIEEANAAKKALRDLAMSIKDFIKEISTSEMGAGTDAQKLAIIKRQFEEEAAAASGGDLEAMKNIQGTASRYLELSKSQSKNALEFARTQASVVGRLDNLANKTIAETEPQTIPEQIKAVTDDLAAKLAKAVALVATLTQAATEAGAETVKAEEDILGEYRKALEEHNKATTELAALIDASKGIAELIISPLQQVKDLVVQWETIRDFLATPAISAVDTGPDVLDVLADVKKAYSSFTEAITIRDAYQIALDRLLIDTTDLVKTPLDSAITSLNKLVTEYGDASTELLGAAAKLNSLTDGVNDLVVTTTTVTLDVLAATMKLEAATTSATATAQSIIEPISRLIITVPRLYARIDEMITATNNMAANIANNTTAVFSLSGSVAAAASMSAAATRAAAERSASASEASAAATIAAAEIAAAAQIAAAAAAAEAAAATTGTTEEVGAVAGFAKGGNHFGGLRLVGEEGPELEATGPSKIFTAKQTSDMLNNTSSNEALLQELKALRLEIAGLRYSAERTEDYNRKTKDLLLRVTRDGNSLLTEAA